ncbi:MAG: DUF5104 domain-containing protein [Lachnospira sp.]|nr:DUF5104 domain-containing protein [Lachnospira sp.]
MGFVSMFFIMILIMAGIFAVVEFIAFILLLVSKRRMKKTNNKKGKVGYTIASIILWAPIAAAVLFGIGVGIYRINLSIERTHYENFVDRWRNEHVGESDVRDEVFEQVFTLVDSKDKEAFAKIFPKNIQGSTLDKNIEEFYKEYPEGLSEGSVKETSFSSRGGGDWEIYVGYEVELNNETYYVKISAMWEAEDKNDIGITKLVVESEKAYVLRNDYNGTCVAADTVLEEDFEVRHIGGRPYRYENADSSINEAAALSFIKANPTYEAFKARFGEPNAIEDLPNVVGVTYFYRLDTNDQSVRYLELSVYKGSVSYKNCSVKSDSDVIKYFSE